MYLSVIEYFADFVIELGNLKKIKICKDYIFSTFQKTYIIKVGNTELFGPQFINIHISSTMSTSMASNKMCRVPICSQAHALK